MEITIQPCSNVDVIRNLSIETFTQTFKDSNTEKDLQDYIDRELNTDILQTQIDDARSIFYVADVDGIPAAFMKVNIDGAQTEPMGAQCLEIQRIYVLVQYKKHGLGSVLIEQAKKAAQQFGKSTIWLGVWEHNDAAIGFYEHKGFTKFSEHSFYMGDDEQVDYLMCYPNTDGLPDNVCK